VALGLSFAAALDDGELDELVALSGDVVAAIQD
jgi:hypothetical protein